MGKEKHGLSKLLHNVEKGLRKPVKKIAKKAGPVLGAIAGNMIAPGIGAPLGGALMGALGRGHGNKGKGAVSGALQGAAYLGGSELGSYLNNQMMPPSHSSASPAYQESESHIQGRPNDAISDHGPAPYAQARNLQDEYFEAYGGVKSDPSTYVTAFNKYAVPLVEALKEKALPVSAALLKAYAEQKGQQAEQAEQKVAEEEEELAQSGMRYQPQMPQSFAEEDTGPLAQASMMESPLDVFRKLFPKKQGDNHLSKFMPEHHNIRQYAHGGSVGHIKQSDSSGIADDITTKIPEGSYVWNTTDTSLLGDGSPDNGIKKIRQMESHFERSGIARSHQHNGRLMDVKLSNDEYVMEPRYVAALGEKFAGNPSKGAQVIDKARMSLRKQKGVQKILPPKAKDVKAYFKGGR